MANLKSQITNGKSLPLGSLEPRVKIMTKKVVILGGGVAGMSAAHELMERGFEVEVYELRDIPGGKARSYSVKRTATPDHPGLPGEHGFRFFPRFYKHLPDTM